MKTNQTRKIFLSVIVMIITVFCATTVRAQVKVADKEIVGVWVMSSMKYVGEDRNRISEEYTRVKVYRSNGEYACAEIKKMKNGNYSIVPHEYGTYYLKNGMYSEMGRKETEFGWVDKTSAKGQWQNWIEEWKKDVDFPAALTKHIVEKCKVAQVSPEKMQKLMQKHIFGVK